MPKPPKYAERLLCWFLKKELVEEVMGDLDEKFHNTLREKSLAKAKRNYWYQVLFYCRPFAIKNYRSNSIYFMMYKSYFKISYRNLLKNRGFAFINIGGLALGMSVAILMATWVFDELSFNKIHSNYEQIAQVLRLNNWGGEFGTSVNGSNVTGLGTLLKETYPDKFRHVVMTNFRSQEVILSAGTDHFSQQGYFMSPDGPEMLSFDMLYGTRSGLKNKNSILICKSLAHKFFGDQDPVNKVVRLNSRFDLRVAGVYSDFPPNSTFAGITYTAPLELFTGGTEGLEVWDNYNMKIYVQLQENADMENVSSLIRNAMLPHVEADREETKPTLFLNPMKKWHLYSQFENGTRVKSDRMKMTQLLASIGLFVLLLACINFMNLSTARSEQRAKEIGVRKSIGSRRKQLISQFLTESILLSVFSFVIALAIAWALLPWFNSLTGKEMVLPLYNYKAWLIGICITLFTGLLSGSYPAFYLSSFNSLHALKGTFKVGWKGTLPRKILVVFQFTVSTMHIISTLLVFTQIQYAKNRGIGYQREGLLVLPKGSPELYDKYEVLRNELKRSGAVLEVGEANYPLTNTLGNNNEIEWEGKDPDFSPTFNTIRVNFDYGKTINWELIAGRDFSRLYPGEAQQAVIITDSARALMGFEDPIGKSIHFESEFYGGPDFTIVGVVKDMVKGSPFEKVRPAIMFLTEKESFWMFMRLNPGLPISQAITTAEEVFHSVVPNAPFEYKFMEDEYAKKFRSEERIGSMALFFTIVAIFISCLGLYGLAAYMANKRMKEIGIRKVLGASIASLWQMLSKDFIKLALIAICMATPLAYYFLNNWLGQFGYRTDLHWWILAAGGAVGILITLLTVSHQAVKAAVSNPVDSLRSE